MPTTPDSAPIIRIEPADMQRPDEVNCADEPIRVPGSIQPHGFLLGIHNPGETVTLASQNVESFLGVPLRLVLGAELDQLLEREVLTVVRASDTQSSPTGLVSYLGTFRVGSELFSVLAHNAQGRRIFEFERVDRLVGPEMMNRTMTNFVSLLGKLRTEQDVCRAVTDQIAQLTGFNRVLLYCFDKEGHGTVLTEVNDGVLPSYLDLRFPSSDIPAQARALYIENTVRIIPDANYTPVPLQEQHNANKDRVDLSLCVLRSVSPVHLEYMRNMGTLASMSISIVCEGRLWGLISCHHSTPELVPYLTRSACDLLSKMVGTQISVLETAARLQRLVTYHDVQRTLLTQIASEHDYLGALLGHLPTLQAVTSADGVAFALDGDIQIHGVTPPIASVRRLILWIREQPADKLLHTDCLGEILPWASDISEVASGVLCIRVSGLRERFIIWFRQELIRKVRWAGEPVKRVDAAHRLHPRLSFESWQELVRGQAKPWSQADLDSAQEFRAALSAISLRRAEEEAELNEARFNKLTHTLPIKIFAVTDDGELSYVNAQWLNEELGNSGLWFAADRLDAEDSARCHDKWRETVRQDRDFEEEVRFLVKTGTALEKQEISNLVRIVPFRRAGADRAGWIGAAIDLSERKEREQRLLITDKLAQTARMTSYFAHEINNPLEAVTNLAFILRLQMQADEASLSYLTELEKECDRIAGAVKQTIRWTSENSDKMQWCNVSEMFTDVLHLLSAKIRNRDLNVAAECDLTLEVFGILGQLRQVIAHLVSNGIDALPVGGHLSLSASKEGSAIRFIVRDEGVGISTADQRKLFEPFFSTKGDLGNGLGLYISQEIIERHNGHIHLESAPSSGTTVTVDIPVTQR